MGLSDIHVNATAENAMGIATFYGCVKFICNQIACLPYNVLRYEEGKGSVRQADHPLDYILGTRFNKNMGPFVAKRALLLNCLVHGWAVAEIVRDEYNKPFEIIPYPTRQVYLLHHRETDSYFFNIPHLNKTLTQDNVIFIRDLSFDGATGASVISWQEQTIEIDLTAKEFAHAYFKNGTFMGGIITNPAMANVKTKEDAKRVKSDVVDAFKSAGGGYGFAVFAPGVNYIPIGINPADSKLLEIFAMSDKDIAKMWNLSLAMIGDTEVQSSWGAGVEAMYTILTNSVLVPIAKQVEEEIDYKCFSRAEIKKGFFTRHNFRGLLRGDFKTQSEHLRGMVKDGIYMPDEAREHEDMAPLPNKTGARAYMNGTMTPLDLMDEVLKQKINGNTNSPAGIQRGEGDPE
ncbi:phage portal protein [Dyadobacter sp. CY323]|uniref:phage portal protein n=1 Tax=Dyadobacter sp. CY323 TaxID=2907302 RepID=UPI001F1FD1A5|nr:phage portal protein [Dyadobacter sp. CY323]MCE6992093.1 phage portal protein [Dyadobacter sp. CY323]